jgi:hypothetical protein
MVRGQEFHIDRQRAQLLLGMQVGIGEEAGIGRPFDQPRHARIGHVPALPVELLDDAGDRVGGDDARAGGRIADQGAARRAHASRDIVEKARPAIGQHSRFVDGRNQILVHLRPRNIRRIETSHLCGAGGSEQVGWRVPQMRDAPRSAS